jgi:uncharacterized protein YeaO (DUF488 family)
VSVRIVRLGSPRSPGEGLRIGSVRRPPRGVPKKEFASRDFYDVWLPALSPSVELLTEFRSASARTLDLLAALSHSADFSLGCYCRSEEHCHRRVLRRLLIERGAKL